MNKGSIEITEVLYSNNWDQVCYIFKHFKPYHLERNQRNGNYIFFGYSEKFDKLIEGERIPEYLVTIHYDEEEQESSVSFERSK